MLFILIQSTQADREEKVLTAAFGDDYQRYKKQTWF